MTRVKKNPHIANITYLKRRPNAETAKDILHDINNSVALLMRENGLKVKTLSEFYPKQKNLYGLNVNHGLKIMLRLRQPLDDSRFLSREEIMNTMIHELTHNRVGPHNDKFKKQMSEWCGRQYVIETLGLTENFLGVGKRLGGRNIAGNYSISQRRLQLLSKSKPTNSNRLGTSGINSLDNGKPLSAREMAAKAAMERLQKRIPKEVFKVNENNNADEDVDVQEVLTQHDMMDSQLEEIICLDSDSDTEIIEPEEEKRSVSEPKEIEIIDLT